MSRVQGADALRQHLRSLPDAIQAGVQQEIRAIAEDTADAARAAVPKRTGRTAGAIEVRLSEDGLSAQIGVFKRGRGWPFWARFIEFGARAHDVAKGGGTKRAKKNPKHVARHHPGTRPRPFLGPAFLAAQKAGLPRLREAIRRALDQGREARRG